ncbi:MAG: glycosyl hydrolase [Reinekea sp.]|nr:glycosyl hydrolase [Reinekea sp.]
MINKNNNTQKAPIYFARHSLFSAVVLGATLTAAHAATIPVGAGSIADQANPEGYTCSIDHGTWVHNAGVVEPAIAGCDEVNGPIGNPTPLYPHLTGPAANKHTGTHRWWGSVSFFGDMPIGDVSKAGYITPDPITARVSNRGFRMLSIPGGLAYKNGNADIYEVPGPFDEVFDGLAIANSQYSNMDAKLYDYSDGSMTVEWQQNGTAIMRATFVHGSPYVYVDVLRGELVLKSKAQNGPEKNVYHQSGNQLGLWTDVAGNRGTFLVVGEGDTQFIDVESQNTRVQNSSGHVTIALLPTGDALPDAGMINRYAQYALNRIDEVNISYNVSDSTQAVTITQQYLNNGQPVQTMAGLLPMAWKNAVTPVNAQDQIRSARGYTKFAPLSSFSYELPFVGVLPTLPAQPGSYDVAKLTQLIDDFIAQGPGSWNDKGDTYWAGKNYGKVAELAALAYSHGLTAQHQTLTNWLKAELEDWFTAQTNGVADKTKYFSYDSEWNTLLGYDESFGAQQQLNDHHFHYGYFVRAAAEVCRTDKSWCAPNAWGGMVEMLIRDYAADRNDPMFPYARNFDPAYGFSWASGHANFTLGNNNESTSEAANAYGAIVLYGMITGNEALTEHGMYLHASSTAAYWEYWNNIDRYLGKSAPYDNFSPEYDKMTTSIIWGNGHVFSTWFSGAYAHILGIQGLPLNPLVMHIGQHADYLKEYVKLGLKESGNGKPSGLSQDQWRDVWWNIWAMTEPEAAIADFNTMNFNYDVEAGETVAHTYQWIHSFAALGHLKSGNGSITADSPAAMVFDKNGALTYVAYNFSNQQRLVTFSDGMAICVGGNQFGLKKSGQQPDTCAADTVPPSQPGVIAVNSVTSSSASLSWAASTDNVGVVAYDVTVAGDVTINTTAQVPLVSVSGLNPSRTYNVTVVARDDAGNTSIARTGSFTTSNVSGNDQPPTAPANVSVSGITQTGATVTWTASSDDKGVSHYVVNVLKGNTLVTALSVNGTERVLTGLDANTAYRVDVVAIDTAQQSSAVSSASFTTKAPVVSCTDFCLAEQGSSLVVTSKVGVMVDLHFKVNNGAQQNVRMTPVGNEHEYVIANLQKDDTIDYFFTVIDGPAYDTAWAQHIFGSNVVVTPDTEAPTQPGTPVVSALTHNSVQLNWNASTDNVALDHYEVSIAGFGDFIATTNALNVTGLSASTTYSVSVVAVDTSNNVSNSSGSSFTTQQEPQTPTCDTVCASNLNANTVRVVVQDGGIADIHYNVNGGAQQNVRMAVVDGHHQYDITNLNAGDVVNFFVTVINGPAYDTAWQSHTFNP